MGGVSIERVVGRWLSRVTGGGAGPGRRPGPVRPQYRALYWSGEGRGGEECFHRNPLGASLL